MPERLAAFTRFCLWIFSPSLFFFSSFLHAAEIRGKIVSVDRGEPLGRVQVAVLAAQHEAVPVAVTKNDGSFVIQGLGPGNYTLRLNAVGYRLITVDFSLADDEAVKEFDITLVPDNVRRTERVEVKGDIFQGPDSPAINEINMTSSEIRETSTVLVDDPFRAVQTLPGVSASGNNDFFAQFSVMGASYDNTSIYLDGILVPLLFHGAETIGEGATLSLLTSETIEDIKLLPAGYPQKYGDSVGAALNMSTREGSRTQPTFRASIGLADTDLLGEGQLGHSRRGSWLASARKSYLGYLLRNRLNETFTDISFYDADLKLIYDVSSNQTISFYGLGGHTLADILHPTNPLQPGEFKRGTNDLILGRVGWRWSVNPHLLLDARVALIEAPLETWDIDNNVLQNNRYREWVTGGNVAWAWRKEHVLEGGWTSRYARRSFDFLPNVGNPREFITSAGWRNAGFVQQTSSFWNNRLHIVGSLRFDTAAQYDVRPVSPQISAALQVGPATQLQLGVGRYNEFEFPSFADSSSGNTCAPLFDYLQTANHYTAAVERRFGESTRFRAMFFDRQNQRLTSSVGNCALRPRTELASVGENYSRGVQIVLQSRTANRLSGWVGYTLTYARQNGFFFVITQPGVFIRVLSPYYPTLEDQRHTLNAFASYRLTPTVNLSAKWLYGSGFPVPSGLVKVVNGQIEFLGLNATRLGIYQRLDVRAEKDWAFKRWKLALYGEIMNLTNHNNPRYIATTSVDPSTGQSGFRTEQGLPITPTAGLAFEF